MLKHIFKQNAKAFANILKEKPAAKASVKGSSEYPKLHGAVYFYKALDGTLVSAEIYGLPAFDKKTNKKLSGIHGFHIHSGGSCTGDSSDPFKNAGSHYNPSDKAHPLHAGDMPPLFSNNGYAYMSFYTNRFTTDEVIGKTVLIHESADDFSSQPAGNAGKKIGCGIIKRYI